jgi:hypothetical protein
VQIVRVKNSHSDCQSIDSYSRNSKDGEKLLDKEFVASLNREVTNGVSLRELIRQRTGLHCIVLHAEFSLVPEFQRVPEFVKNCEYKV